MAERNRRATPHLCCQRELLFPFMWLNPSVSKISLRFSSHIAHNHPAFAEQTDTFIRQMQIQPTLPLGASSLVSVGGICCVTSFGSQFFHYCHIFEVHVLLSAAGLKLLFVWYSALVFLTSQRGQKYSPLMDHGGQLKARLIQGRVWSLMLCSAMNS